MSQCHHCGYYWHLMANAMLSRRSRAVCSASPCLLGSMPPPPLSCSVVLSGCSEPTYLCHKQPLLSLLVGAKWGTHWRKGLGNKYKRPLSSLGVVKAQSPGVQAQSTGNAQDSTCFLIISWSSSVRFTQICASYILHLKQRQSAKWPWTRSVIRQAQAISKVSGKRT